MSPPPPPPPLPAHLDKASKLKNSIPLPRLRSGAFPPENNTRSLQISQDTNAIVSSKPFKSCYMFFYGSLMDPDVLQAILKLPAIPIIRPATVSGFSIKMWGIYPALIPDISGRVLGTVWEIDSEVQFQRLEAYETTAYRWQECDAILNDGEVLKECRTFCWARDSNSKELEGGSFD